MRSANIVYPLYVFSAVLVTSLVLGLLIGGRRLEGRVVVESPATDPAWNVPGSN